MDQVSRTARWTLVCPFVIYTLEKGCISKAGLLLHPTGISEWDTEAGDVTGGQTGARE